MQEIKKVCALCGKEFTTIYTQKKYCSNECKYTARKQMSLKYYYDHYEYEKERNRRINKLRYQKKTDREYNCVVCGKPLPKGKSKYCSDECKKLMVVRHEEEKNVCFVCGEPIPDRVYSILENYVIHEKCLCKTTMHIDQKRVWKGEL